MSKVADSDSMIGTFEEFCDYMRNNYRMRDIAKICLQEYENLFANLIKLSKEVQECYLSFDEQFCVLTKLSKINSRVIKDYIIRKILPHIEYVKDIMEGHKLINPKSNIFEAMD